MEIVFFGEDRFFWVVVSGNPWIHMQNNELKIIKWKGWLMLLQMIEKQEVENSGDGDENDGGGWMFEE